MQSKVNTVCACVFHKQQQQITFGQAQRMPPPEIMFIMNPRVLLTVFYRGMC